MSDDESAPLRHSLPLESTSVSAVTVFSDRAEVSRALSLSGLPPGAHLLSVKGLSTKIDEESVRVKASAGSCACTLLEVSFEVHSTPVDEEAEPASAADAKRAELKQLQAALDVLQDELEREGASKALIDTYVTGMLSPSKDGPPPVGEKLSGVRELLSFQAQAAAEHSAARLRIEGEIAGIRARVEAVEAALRRLAAPHRPRTKTSRDVEILVQVPGGDDPKTAPRPLSLTLTYMVTGASWSPSYDLRVETAGKDGPSMSLTYSGLVSNASGEDWTQCRLRLSTARPSKGGMPPVPPRRLLGWLPEPLPRGRMLNARAMSAAVGSGAARRVCAAPPAPPGAPAPMAFSNMMLEDRLLDDADEVSDELFSAATTSVAESAGGAATFAVERLCTIEADNKPHRVTVALLDFSPKLVFFATPSLEQSFYTQVRATNTSAFPLLASSKVACFLDGSFVTTTRIGDVMPSEEFTTFLGADPSIKLDHATLAKAHRSAQGWASKTQAVTHSFRTKINNTKQTPVYLTVVEVLPKPTEDKIKVELVAPSKAEITEANTGIDADTAVSGAMASGGERILQNSVTNNIVWQIMLAPGEKRELNFQYTVSWPAEKQIHEYSVRSGPD